MKFLLMHFHRLMAHRSMHIFLDEMNHELVCLAPFGMTDVPYVDLEWRFCVKHPEYVVFKICFTAQRCLGTVLQIKTQRYLTEANTLLKRLNASFYSDFRY